MTIKLSVDAAYYINHFLFFVDCLVPWRDSTASCLHVAGVQQDGSSWDSTGWRVPQV